MRMIDGLIGASPSMQGRSIDTLNQTQQSPNKGSSYNPGPLVSSSINNTKKNFRSPFLRQDTTWGYVEGKINKNTYDKDFQREFIGKDSPPPTAYIVNDIRNFNKT